MAQYPKDLTTSLLGDLVERLNNNSDLDLLLYQSDPCGYACDILKVSLTDEQSQMLESVRDNRYTAAKASHAIGKTFCAAILVNWWYDCWDSHIAYITAPTWSQALDLTFKQTKRFRRELNLSGRILETGKILDENKTKELSHYVKAINAERGEGFQGEHSAPILIILEEAVGVPKYIWEAMGGLMTHPACRVFAIGNPTEDSNPFGDACESAAYNTITISVLDHPNIEAELNCKPPVFPDAVRLQWLYEMLRDECERVEIKSEDAFEFYSLEDIKNALEGKPLPKNASKVFYLPTAYFQGRALGEFPTQADQQVIPRAWLKSLAVIDLPENTLPEIGCDVARFGDDRSTIFGRIGACILFGKELRKLDNLAVTSALKDAAKEAAGIYLKLTGNLNPSKEEIESVAKKIPIKIDTTGGLGTAPFDLLKAEGYKAVAINSSNKAIDSEQYPNRRSELWFDARVRARNHGLDLSRLPKELREKLIKELSTPKYAIKNGKKTVEDKSEIKKRLGASPDLADGFNLMFAKENIVKAGAV